MATTVLVLIVLHSLVAAAAAQQQQPRVARPGCRGTCGSITIPYPFGIGAGCYRDDGTNGFQLRCDDSTSRLTMAYQGFRLAALSLTAGEATTYMNATRRCYNSTGMIDNERRTYMFMSLENSPYLFSSNKTRLVALGCPTFGYFVDGPGQYISGCTSVCRPTYDLPGPCTGLGCCQSAIPPGVSVFEPHQGNFTDDPTLTAQDTSCFYVFLVQTEWFDSSDRFAFNRTDDFDVPVVLDWAIRNVGNCSAARRNQTDFACRSELSECVDSTNNGGGYRCNCPKGYDGNPYLDEGCADIDECQLKGKDQLCFGDCTNTPGDYTCKCHPRTSGNATINK